MKKIFTLGGVLLALVSLNASAQKITTISTEEDMMYYGGHMPLKVSNNGSYVVGSTLAGAMFLSDWQNQKSIVFLEEHGSAFDQWGAELRDVTDNGVAVGYDDNGGVIVDATGKYEILEPVAEGSEIVLCERVTADGSLVVGSTSDWSYNQKPCYWENGQKVYLPVPTSEEIGFNVNGAAAKYVSEDGQLIVGWIVDDISLYPMIIWERQDDGTYVCNPVCKDFFQPLSETTIEDNPYLAFYPAALSADGKTVAMQIIENTDEDWPATKIGLYDVATGELQVIEADGNHGIEAGSDFTIGGVANDGTVVGYTGNFFTGITAFVMSGDEKQPKLLHEAYQDAEGMDSYAEFAAMGATFMASSISADGRYITGFGEYADWDTGLYGYRGYVLDTKAVTTSIEAVETVKENGQTEYYTLDGRKVNAPVKGLNIVKTADGKTKKIVVK